MIDPVVGPLCPETEPIHHYALVRTNEHLPRFPELVRHSGEAAELRPMSQPAQPSQVERFLVRVADGVSPTSIDHLLSAARSATDECHLNVESVLAPETFRSRVEDTCRVRANEMERTFAVHHVSSAGALETPEAVCLVRPVKGRSLRGFSAVGRTGATLRLLGQTERQVTMMRTLLVLLSNAAGSVNLRVDAMGPWDEALAHLVLCQPNLSTSRQRDELEDRIGAVLCGLLCQPTTPATQRLIRAAQIAATRDPVLVEVHPEDTGRLSYTQLDAYGARDRDSGTSESRRYARRLADFGTSLGSIPNHLTLSGYKSNQSDDYSLEVIVPDGNFISAVKSADNSLPVRGLGTQRVSYEAPQRTMSPETRRGAAEIRIEVKQMPSGGLFRATSLALVVAGVSSLVTLSASKFHGNPVNTTALEVLSWSTGIASVAFIATWAVLRHTVEEMAFEPIAIASAFISSGVLVALIGVLAYLPGFSGGLTALLSLSVFNALWSVSCLVGRLAESRSARKADAMIDPEGPLA